MATSRTPVQVHLFTSSNSGKGPRNNAGILRVVKRLSVILAGFLMFWFLGACGVFNASHYGSPIRSEHIASLQPGVSTISDILLMLGEPRGRGMARLSSAQPLTTVWVYEQTDSEDTFVGRTRRHLALFFFKDNLYDGHIEFSYTHTISYSSPGYASFAAIVAHVGTWPDTGKLESALKPGTSTRAEIVTLLGEPAGKGSALLPIADKPKTLWLYQREEITRIESRHAMLFIFLDKDILDGYLWFSTFPGK